MIPSWSQWLCVNVLSARAMLVLRTTSAVPRLSWKEVLTNSANYMDSKNRVYLLTSGLPKFLPQEVKLTEWIWKSNILTKLKPTAPLQTTVVTWLREDCPHKVNLDMLATVKFTSRVWSPGRNTIVVLEVKYCSASCAYSESVAQGVSLWGQDEHEVLGARVGLTQYTFSAEQREKVLRRSVAARAMNGVDWAITASSPKLQENWS